MNGFGLNQCKGVGTPRTTALMNKVFDHLDSIDVSKLSTIELKDFLEVVQKGQFLESYGQMPGFGFGGLGCCGPQLNTVDSSIGGDTKSDNAVE